MRWHATQEYIRFQSDRWQRRGEGRLGDGKRLWLKIGQRGLRKGVRSAMDAFKGMFVLVSTVTRRLCGCVQQQQDYSYFWEMLGVWWNEKITPECVLRRKSAIPLSFCHLFSKVFGYFTEIKLIDYVSFKALRGLWWKTALYLLTTFRGQCRVLSENGNKNGRFSITWKKLMCPFNLSLEAWNQL